MWPKAFNGLRLAWPAGATPAGGRRTDGVGPVNMAQGGLDHRQPVAGGARSHSRYGFSARGRATGGPRVLYRADPVPQASTSGSPNRPKQTGKTQPSLALAWPVRVWVRVSTLGTMVPPQAISPGGDSKRTAIAPIRAAQALSWREPWRPKARNYPEPDARWTQEPEPQEPQEARNYQLSWVVVIRRRM